MMSWIGTALGALITVLFFIAVMAIIRHGAREEGQEIDEWSHSWTDEQGGPQ